MTTTLRRAVTLNLATVPPDAAGETDAEAKWVQVAYEGQFLGYRDGAQPFAFTRGHFEQAIANLRSNPSYRVGPDGYGASGVIPWDFNHASEMDPTSGTLPVVGAPSQGWTLDMEVRDGPDGRAQLWALTSFYEPARSYVRQGQYAWASVTAIFDATHQESGENVGMLITSIALTNTPFLEGMERLVASRHFYAEAASGPDDAFKQMRSMFGLPETADVSIVMGELARLIQWVDTGAAPLGVDLEGLVADLRKILALPALTDARLVLDSAGQIVQRLMSEAALGDMPTAAPAPTEEDQMLKKLSQILGVTESESAVEDAVVELAKLRDGVIKTHSLDRRVGASVALEAVAEAAEAGVDARAKLAGLLKALGVDDVDGAVDKVATLIQQADELTQVMPELSELRAKTAEIEEAQEEADVEAAMASYKLPEGVREALRLQRHSNPEKFAEKFPRKAVEASASAVVQGAPAVDAKTLTSRVAASTDKPTPSVAGEINLDEYEGRNPTERAMTYLALTNEGWSNLTWDQKVKAAIQLKRRENVKFSLAL